MGAVRAGDIRQLTIGGREIDIKGGDANVNIDLGGYSNEVGINGNGSVHNTQRRKIAGFSDCPVSVDDVRQDLEYLQGLSDAGRETDVTMTLASGVTYRGALIPVGDIVKATGDGTLTLEMRGSKFEQI
jgi:hypothetical protein